MTRKCGFGMLCPVLKAVGVHVKCVDDKKPVKKVAAKKTTAKKTVAKKAAPKKTAKKVTKRKK